MPAAPATTPPVAPGIDPGLRDACQRWKRRWRLRLALTGALLGLAWGVWALPLILGLERVLPAPGGLTPGLAWTLLLVPAGLLAAGTGLVLVFASPSAGALARRAEALDPALEGYLLSAIELPAEGRSDSRDSLAFRRELQRRAGELARSVPETRLLPWATPGLRGASGSLVVGLVVLGVLLLLPGSQSGGRLARLLLPGSGLALGATSRLVFEPLPEWIAEGDDVTLRVGVEGPPVNSCSLVWEADTEGSEPVTPFHARGGPVPPGTTSGTLPLEPDSSGIPGSSEVEHVLVLEHLLTSLRGTLHATGAEPVTIELRVAPRPRVLEFTRTVHPPAYLPGGEVVRHVDSQGDITALQGSTLDLVLRADQALSAARLLLELEGEEGRELELAIDEVGQAHLEKLPLERPGSYRLALTSRRTGLENLFRPQRALRLELDRPPGIEVLRPVRNSIVGPGDRLPVEIRARDDVGLASLVERLLLDGEELRRRTLATWSDGLEAVHESEIDLGELAVPDGARVELVHELRDLRGHVTPSESRWLQVSARRQGALADRAVRDLLELVRSLETLRSSSEKHARAGRVILAELRREPRSPRHRTRLEDWLTEGGSLLEALVELASRAGEVATRDGDPWLHADLWLARDVLEGMAWKDWNPALGLVESELARLSREPSGAPGPSLPFGAPPVAGILDVAAGAWSQGHYRLESLARGLPLLVLGGLLEATHLDQLVPLGARLDRLLEAGDETGPGPDLEALALELEGTLTPLIRFPLPGAPAGVIEQSHDLSLRLEALLERLPRGAGSRETFSWRSVAADLGALQTPVLQVLEEIEKSSPGIRSELAALQPGTGDEVLARARQLETLERDLLEAIGEAGAELSSSRLERPDSLAMEALAEIFRHPRSTRLRLFLTPEGRPRWEAILGSLERERRRVSLSRPRRSSDVLELDRVLRVVGELPAIFEDLYSRSDLGKARFHADTSLLEELLNHWKERANRETLRTRVAPLASAGRAFRILRLAHRLPPLAEQARELVEDGQHEDARLPARSRRARERSRRLREQIEKLAAAADELAVEDLAASLRDTHESPSWTEIRRLERLREREGVDFSRLEQRELVDHLARLEGELAELAARETPLIHAARRALRELAPGLLEEMRRALEVARKARDATGKSLESSPGDLEGIDERLLRHEFEASGVLARLRERLVREASSLDPTSADDRREARRLDVATRWLEPEFPGPDAHLIAASVAESEERVAGRRRALELQTRRVERLQSLIELFRLSEEDPDRARSMQEDLESEMGIDEELDRRYRELEELAGLVEDQGDLLDRTRELDTDSPEDPGEEPEIQEVSQEQLELARSLARRAMDSPRTRQALVAELVQGLRDLELALERLGGELEVLDQRREQVAVQREVERTQKLEVLAHRAERLGEVLAGLPESRPVLESRERARLEGTVATLRHALDAASKELTEGGLTQILESTGEELAAILEGLESRYLTSHPALEANRGDEFTELLRRLELERGEVRLHHARATASDEESEREASSSRERELEIRREIIRLSSRQSETGGEALREKIAMGRKLAELRVELEGLLETRSRSRARRRLEARHRDQRLQELTARLVLLTRDLEKASSGSRAPVGARLVQSADALAWAIEKLEARELLEALRWLDESVLALGALDEDRLRGLDRSLDLLAALRESRRQLGALGETHLARARLHEETRTTFEVRQEQALTELASILEALGASREIARLLSTGGIDLLDSAARDLEPGALSPLMRVLEIESARGPLRESIRESARGRASLVSARQSIRTFLEALENATGEPAPTGSARSGSTAEARSSARALSRMQAAHQSLERKAPGRAVPSQTEALRSLSRALGEKARELSKKRQQELRSGGSSGRGEPESGTPAESGGSGSSRPGGTPGGDDRGEGIDAELLESLLGGGAGSGDWARLPSELRRQLLRAHREGVSPRYRELVEAYFRALAEAARQR